MKKIICAIMLSLSVLFMFGCNKISAADKDNSSQNDTVKPDTDNPDNEETKDNGGTAYSIKDIYPFNDNVVYEYAGNGNEYAKYTVWVDYIDNNRAQIRKNNGGTELVTVLENKDGELRSVLSREETYFRENFTTKQGKVEEVFLKEPLVKGTSWTAPDGSKRYISNTEVEITTNVGKFKALEVTTEGKNYKKLDYYAAKNGLVKTVYTSQGSEVTSTLDEIKKDTPLVQNVRIYYPSGDEMKLYYVEKQLSFKTNDITRLTLEKLFKEVPKDNVGSLLGPNVNIKSLYLNNGVVYVDFSENLVKEMNAGSSYELNILQGITNTLGAYYGVDKVYITIEDKPYSSGHILMKNGETFSVSLGNSEKLK
ncbi:GerMN domain-containing protein [Clostridium sp. YIM B02506]|uniref:GerMN domain-containing protein n=1 Tax=Clostridium sp. YIM B02506 TaxID=2910680 RepID=UPI001EEE5E0C|nr:GerMN domain-containing protein [Clostridium sp. YIM B02506]